MDATMPGAPTDTTYDGIILGAGHNGLILQVYLGLAGLKVLSIERRSVAGGGLTTMEDPRFPGFLHNTHSFYHRGLTRMPWYRDLGLDREGATYIEPELNVALVAQDGRVLEWWTDFERTFDSVAQFSHRDAETLRRWRDDFVEIVADILVPEAQAPPLPPADRERLLSRTRQGRLLLATSALSPLEFVLTEFEHPLVQAGMLFFNGLREVDLHARGFGHHIAALIASPAKAQMCLGGSAALARALETRVAATGGTILRLTEPRQIIVEDGRVTGVETSTGARIRAGQFVASSLNPHQTFLSLMPDGAVPPDVRQRARDFRYNVVAPLFAVNANLHEPPKYAAAARYPELDRALMVIVGLETVDQFPELIRHHAAGTIPPPIMWGSCPTVFDPSQAPPGKHTAFMWEKVPYRLGGDPLSWDRESDRHRQDLVRTWATYAPNLPDAMIESFARSPLDTERTLPNMREGDLLVGALTDGQWGFSRPFAGAGHYRGHVPGLYLCGASSHPGGNITGLPGYNCAQTILRDLGLPAPWMPQPIDERLARLT